MPSSAAGGAVKLEPKVSRCSLFLVRRRARV